MHAPAFCLPEHIAFVLLVCLLADSKYHSYLDQAATVSFTG